MALASPFAGFENSAGPCSSVGFASNKLHALFKDGYALLPDLLLLQGLETVQSNAAAWKAQAQDNLHQVNQLKSLLEESAFWGANGEADSAGQQQSKQTEIPQGDANPILK